MAYTTQETVEAQLKRDLTSAEEILFPMLQVLVDKSIDIKLGGTYNASGEVVRYYDGGRQIIPIGAVRNYASGATAPKVYLVSSAGDLNEYDASNYVFGPLNSEVKTYLELRHGEWACGERNIAIRGEFSYGEDVPGDIEYLSSYLIARFFTVPIEGELSSQSIEGYSVSWARDSTIEDLWDAKANMALQAAMGGKRRIFL